MTFSPWIGLFGAAVVEGRPVLGACALALAVSMLVSSLAMLVTPAGYLGACGCWAALVLSLGPALIGAPRAGALGVVLPLLVFVAMAARTPQLMAHIAGKPPPSLRARVSSGRAGCCERCGSTGAVVRAPIWVFSAVFVAASVPGLARELCLRHAQVNALPATVATTLFGWWSPWGLWWTPRALLLNIVEGGGSGDWLEASAGARRRIGWRWMLPQLAAVTGVLVFPLLAMRAAQTLIG